LPPQLGIHVAIRGGISPIKIALRVGFLAFDARQLRVLIPLGLSIGPCHQRVAALLRVALISNPIPLGLTRVGHVLPCLCSRSGINHEPIEKHLPPLNLTLH
jgi:hypothetical protein